MLLVVIALNHQMETADMFPVVPSEPYAKQGTLIFPFSFFFFFFFFPQISVWKVAGKKSQPGHSTRTVDTILVRYWFGPGDFMIRVLV